MQQYLSNMFERTHDVISNVINIVFHMRPNLLVQMRLMHENIERQLKSECHRELELILEMEESFVYADNPLYKETLKRTKRLHKQNSNESHTTTTIIQSARMPYITTNASTNSMTTLKRTNGALSEDNEDDLDEDIGPPIKISRPNGTSTNRISSCK
jgi:hypothetical protein